MRSNLVVSYGKLPLSFEANQGQVRGSVKFLSRGRGYTILFTDDEAFLTLWQFQPRTRRLGKFGLPGRLDSLDAVDPRAGRWPSIIGNLKSLWPLLIPDLGRMVPEPKEGRRGVAAELESQPPQVMRIRLVGGNAKTHVVGLDELPGKSNYFIGNDPGKWRTNVPNYSKVKYQNVYPGVDLVYHGNQRQLEYDFVVAPGADPSQIKLSFAGADGMRVDAASGDLALKLGDEEVRFRKPTVYQPAVAAVSSPPANPVAAVSGLGVRRSSLVTRDSSFVLAGNKQVAFRVVAYDSRRALVIDPVLIYSTEMGTGSTGGATGNGIAVDSSGNAYVTGHAFADFPTTTNAPQQKYPGNGTAFVTKINAAGSSLVYSTYLGGSFGGVGNGIAVDSSGSAYVTGTTNSVDFPRVKPVLPGCVNSSAFVAKLDSTGSNFVYSTCLGGGEPSDATTEGNAIAVDSSGNAYVTGATSASNFPTAFPLQPTGGGSLSSAFVAKLNGAGSTLVYSTYLGSNASGNGIAVDSSGSAYVTGSVAANDFPTVNPLQPTCASCQFTTSRLWTSNAFVAEFNAGGSALVYSTYLGGSGSDSGNGIALDSSGNAYVTGTTNSHDFPTRNSVQGYVGGTCNLTSSGSIKAPCADAFVAKLSAGGSALVYSTYLGGSTGNEGTGIGVDSSGNAYVTGTTSSSDFPTAASLQAYQCCNDRFVAELSAAGSGLVYSIFLDGLVVGNGIAVDASGSAYVTGGTAVLDGDAIVAKISPGSPVPAARLSSSSLTFGSQNVGSSTVSQPVTLNNPGTAQLTITSIATSANFGETDNCGGSVAASDSCSIYVTFTPTVTGPLAGRLTITDNNNGEAGSQQTVSLAGTGITVSSSPISTTTTVSANPSTINPNGSTVLTATVTASSGSASPAGNVAFSTGSITLGSAVLAGSGASATASLTVSASQFSSGTNTIMATYGGGSGFGASSGTTTVTVNQPTNGAVYWSTTAPDCSSLNENAVAITNAAGTTIGYSCYVSGTFEWFAAGGGWATSIRVAAPASAPISADYRFYDQDGNPKNLDTTVNNVSSSRASGNEVDFALYADQPSEVELLGATSNAPSYSSTADGTVYAVFYCPDATTCGNVLPQLLYSALPTEPWSLSVPLAFDDAVWTQWSAVGINGPGQLLSLAIYNEDIVANTYKSGFIFCIHYTSV
jgi:hypothetical protein